MNSQKNTEKKLPGGWVLCTSKSNPGRKYYFNKKTGRSSWTKPQINEKCDNANNQKNKKPKCTYNDKKKIVESSKKSVKRKSNNVEEISPQKKKHKEETPTPEKFNKSLNSQLNKSQNQSLSTDKNASPQNAAKSKSTPKTKNSANARLSQLQAQLAAEVQKETVAIADKSPSKTKISPTATQTESQAKVPHTELKSPNLNDSKCSTTTQSPSSDSFQSMPSPSQFLTANKIISSMKAQIPEKYCDNIRHVNTFADIEEGINKQHTEYYFVKHPATPPQFSEASKLVSNIKSKLSYKGNMSKEVAVQKFTSAKQRMEALRTSLTKETEESDKSTLNDSIDKECTNEAMDVDYKPIIHNSPATVNVKESTDTCNNENLVLVVDTNIFIHQLDVIKDVLNSHIKGYSEQPTLLVPWRVINELDRLKDNNNGNGAICKWAKSAMDYLYKSLPENNRIKGQSLRDANSHIYPCELPDDEILNCCLQQSERGKSVILLSNDKNLCNKAIINGVKCIELAELRKLLENKPRPESYPDLHKSIKQYEDAMYQLLSNILENEMRAKYNNLWQHVLFKVPPWTLADVLQCLLKHWIAVFSEVFPRIEHLITELNNTFSSIRNKNPKSLSKSEVGNFKELCLDLAKKCQIIPEYMELAKQTVDRLHRKTTEAKPEEEQETDVTVVAAFEGLWTVFSSYCAKLASGLDIPHSLEDKLECHDPLIVLTSKCNLFADRIGELTASMKGALNLECAGADSGDAQLGRLEAAVRGGFALICTDSPPLSRDKLRAFCLTCKNMLHEACTKFTQLTELLGTCRYKIPND